MILSTADTFAVRALVHLAARKDSEPVPSRLIARTEGLPEVYLLKILGSLVRAQILLVLKGPGGGYRLARPTNKITFLEVVEAVDGRIRGVAALSKGDAEVQARVQAVCERVAEQTRRVLGRVTVADLADKGK